MDDLVAIHDTALRQFDKLQSSMRKEREQCLQDRRFYSIAGAQWEGNLGEQFANRPRFEFNKVHLAVIRIINEYRNNRIGILFTSKEGDEYDDLADKCAGLYRADEQDSCAEEAYDNAFEEAVGGGFGAWRLRAEYEDEEDEDDERQRIRIEPIYDADSCVFFDLDAKRQDKSDASHAFVLIGMSPEAYQEEFNDDLASMPKLIQNRQFDWNTPTVVYIAEYYRVEYIKELIQTWKSLTGEEEKYSKSDFDDDPELLKTLTATGWKKIKEKKIKCKKIHKYIISGSRVLEDCGYIAGKNIPIVPVYGKRWFVDNIERCMGHVRLCKDAQRLKNMQLSKLGELSASSSTQKPILTPEQIVGHELMWAEDNIKDYPYLLINPMTDASGNPVATAPTAYTNPPNVPPAMAALLQSTEADMQDILGNQQGGDQIQSNISGRAVELIQTRLDMQAYIYISNMAKAIKRSAEIWLGMASEVYVEEGRKLKTVGEQGEISSTEIARPVMNDNGEIEYESDLKEAKFDVGVSIGPTSASKRQATVNALTGMMQVTQDPETMQVLSAMAIMNMEGEGVSDVRNYFRQKLVAMGVVKPTEEEQQEMQNQSANQQPDPNSIFLMNAAKKEQALAAKAVADTQVSFANAQKLEAQAAQIISAMNQDQATLVLQQIMSQLQGISSQQQDMMQMQPPQQQPQPQDAQQNLQQATAQPAQMGENSNTGAM